MCSSDLTNGTPLLVKVAAITTFGVGAESVASQSITPAAPSSAPQSVTVVGGNGSASVTWLAPSSTNGATVTGYTVETSSDGGTTWTTMSTSASSPYTLSSLTNGVTYLVRVSADSLTRLVGLAGEPLGRVVLLAGVGAERLVVHAVQVRKRLRDETAHAAFEVRRPSYICSEMNSQTAGCMRQVFSKKMPCSGGIVA